MSDNRYETLMPLYDLQQRSNEEQTKYLTEYRKHFSNKEITDFWGRKENFIYNYMKKIGMEAVKKPRTTRKTVAKKQVEKPAIKPAIKEEQPVFVETFEAPQVDHDGFGFSVNGTYSAEKIIKRLEKLSLILDDEETEFEINLSIKEKVGTA